jgi:hypothetical protein
MSTIFRCVTVFNKDMPEFVRIYEKVEFSSTKMFQKAVSHAFCSQKIDTVPAAKYFLSLPLVVISYRVALVVCYVTETKL